MDLNIDNYELEDLLTLFKINPDFDEDDLKQAKKMVLKTHPDQSKLPAEYFLFYSKAYRIIHGIWEFKNKQKKNQDSQYSHDVSYQPHESSFNKEKKQLLDSFLSKKQWKGTQDFNRWFNEQFEKNKVETEEQTYGYGDWLRSEEDLEAEKTITPGELGEEIERKKQQIRALIVHKEIQELDTFSNQASNLNGNVPEYYSSELFSQLPYEDLRKAHTETVVPVTMDDYYATPQFKDVNQYKNYRSSQDTAPLSEKQAHEFLRNKNKIQEKESTERAYRLAKQMEESKAKQELQWASMKYLMNK